MKILHFFTSGIIFKGFSKCIQGLSEAFLIFPLSFLQGFPFSFSSVLSWSAFQLFSFIGGFLGLIKKFVSVSYFFSLFFIKKNNVAKVSC